MKNSATDSLLSSLKASSEKETLIQLVLLCLLGISFFTFKGGLYLFPMLIVLVHLYFRSFSYLNASDELSGVIKLLMLLILTGVATSLLSNEGASSTVDFFRRASPLLAIPISLYFFRFRHIRRLFSYSMVVGILVALGYSLAHLLQGESTSRLDSFWDVGRWGEILSYSFILLLPLAFKKGAKQSSYLVRVSLLVLLGYIALSGSRAPILVLTVITALYFIFYNRKYFMTSFVMIVFAFTLLHFTFPQQIKIYEDRVVSIFNVKDEYSNVARLKMWEEAALFAKKNLIEETPSFIFGVGMKKNRIKFEEYLKSEKKLKPLYQETNNQFSTSDHHNAFWNLLNRMGVIYTALFFIMIAYMLRLSFKKSESEGCALHQSAFLLLLAYCMFGVFYSNQLSYQTYVMLFLWSFAITYPNKMEQKI